MPTEEKTQEMAAENVQQDEIAAAAQEFYAEATVQQYSEVTAQQTVYNENATQHNASFQEELEAHDRNILAALDEMLARQNRPAPQKKPPEESGLERFALGMVRKGAGIVSLSLILIFMGVVVIGCFFSPDPDYLLPLKLSPVAAVLLGLELLIYHVISGKKFRIHIPAIVISALIIGGCCTMAVVMDRSYNENRTEYNNRTIAAQIYESGYHELRHAADIAEIQVEVDLNPDGAARKSGIASLSADDEVNIRVILDGSYSSPERFASECKTIIDAYRFLGIPVTDFSFTNETRFNSFRLDVNGKFMQDYTEAELADEVMYVIVEDFDYVDDLEDFVGETTETTETIEPAV